MSARDWLRPATKPTPSSVLAEPATVEACADDYRAGAADRRTSEKKDRLPLIRKRVTR